MLIQLTNQLFPPSLKKAQSLPALSQPYSNYNWNYCSNWEIIVFGEKTKPNMNCEGLMYLGFLLLGSGFYIITIFEECIM